MSETIIEVKDLSKRYGAREILKNISFAIRRGSITGLLGANGAGKTTTMNIMTGYLSFDSGEVWINGVNIQKKPTEAKKMIGYLPEIPPLYKDLTVEEYLLYVASLKKVADKKKEVSKVMQLVNLEDRRKDFIKHLSKGMQQRVGFAQALTGNPPVLVLDEPLVGLDPFESKKTRELIKNLKNDHAIIISSHILSEIEELCNDVLVLKDGQVALQTSTSKDKRKKRDAYRVVVKGSREKIEQSLQAYEIIKSVHFIGEHEKGVYEFKVETKSKSDIRDQLFGYLVSKKLSIYGLSREEVSLEEIYFEANNKEDVSC